MSLPDVVVIGAGVVGAACAYYASRAGLSVIVLDQGPVAGGTTGTGDGNLLVSDKPPGPALDLAVDSLGRWDELAAEFGPDTVELTRKGGLAVAAAGGELAGLAALADRQRAAGLDAVDVSAEDLRTYEPLISPDLVGGVFYPQDLYVHPTLATAHLLRASGARVRCGAEVCGIDLDDGMRVTGVRLRDGDRVACGAVVNAAGVRAGEFAALAGTPLPVSARRGFTLVTEPLVARSAGREPPVRHTVYGAGYAATVGGDEPAPGASPIVAGTRAGTVLIGATREPGRPGAHDRSWPLPLLRRLAAQAVAILPFLAQVSALRTYRGLRAATPDRLPVIGPDPWIGGLYHACGHGGSGICLAPATGALIAGMVNATERPPAVDAYPFHPERFGSEYAAGGPR